MNLHDVQPRRFVWKGNLDLAVQPARTQERRVEDICNTEKGRTRRPVSLNTDRFVAKRAGRRDQGTCLAHSFSSKVRGKHDGDASEGMPLSGENGTLIVIVHILHGGLEVYWRSSSPCRSPSIRCGGPCKTFTPCSVAALFQLSATACSSRMSKMYVCARPAVGGTI